MKQKLIDRDLADLIRPGNHGPTFVPEQERNFDAGYMPSQTPMRYIREEVIDGKRYRVYQQ